MKRMRLFSLFWHAGCFGWLVLLGLPLLVSGQESVTRIDSYRVMLRRTQGDARVRTLNSLSWEFRRVRFDSSAAYARKALALARRLGYRAGEADAFNHLGLAYFNKSDNDTAIFYFKNAYTLAETLDDDDARIESLGNIGNAYQVMGDLPHALEYLMKSLKVAERRHDTLMLVRMYNNLAITYGLMKDYPQALQHFYRAESLYGHVSPRRRDLPDMKAELRYNIGLVLEELKQYDLAQAAYREALAEHEANGSTFGAAHAWHSIGSLYGKMGRYDEGLAYLQRALEARRAQSDPNNLAATLVALGTLRNQQGRPAEALPYLTEGADLARKHHLRLNRIEALNELAQTYAAVQRPDDAYRIMQELVVQKDSLYNEENARSLIELTTRYQTAEIEKDNHNLQKQKQMQDQELRHRNLINAALVLLLLAGVGFTGLVLQHRTRLRRAFTILRSTYREISLQKEELARRSAELSEAYDRLRALDVFKETLTGMIVHDLKNPLSAVIAYTEADPRPEANVARQAARQMLHLVLNMLDVQKFESAGVQLQCAPLTVSAVLRAAISQTQFLAEAKNIRLDPRVEPGLAISADEEILTRVLVNLLTNAIKYSPNNGVVVLTAEALSESLVRIGVSDNGPGFPSEEAARLFDKFYQAAPQSTGGVRATGLGLAFCKMAIEAHGGLIYAESTPGQGATFYFTLPAAAESAEALPAAAEHWRPVWQAPDVPALEADVRRRLTPVLDRLRALEVYEMSDILEELEPLSDVAEWAEAVRRAVLSGNEAQYRALIA